MPKINQELLERLADKMGITIKAVYNHVQKVMRETRLERNLAALELAHRVGVNISRYSTAEERAELRGGVSSNSRRHRDDAPVEAVERPVRRAQSRAKKPAKRTKGNTVFVVHGRDDALRRSMFEFLRALGLHPLEWEHAIDEANEGNPYVGKILNVVMEKAEAIVVLFSPDDLVELKPHFVKAAERSTEGKQQGQARPNVLFEAGLALGAYPDKTVMVSIGRVKDFSDIGGRHMVRLNDSTQSRNSFASRLARKCQVNRIGNDWMTAGKFEPTESKPAKKRA
ncbi:MULTISPECIES: nucleotide-binding protein [unclassified Bradyrhizobium]|uniref:nucleotide-binding protein n=1 Tax=unclassified Bradyrhizobium TaxID=2631580 RepID=UPI0020B1FA22|nr:MULTISPECIES: TIR domain-containing protein [unclassified Bradyrhizobium]MCP3397810.1 nucleotide-binding protein [Bradyrhizobium sp. CCGB20]MCP3406399.1 nucleotide-binding protein [Bradyrhizobium sp. CCGB01]